MSEAIEIILRVKSKTNVDYLLGWNVGAFVLEDLTFKQTMIPTIDLIV